MTSTTKEMQDQKTNSNNNSNDVAVSLEPLLNIAKEKGFEIEQNKDYGFGPIDLVWNITIHPALPKIRCGFVVLRTDEPSGYEDTRDNEYSLRKIQEAAMRGIRSGSIFYST